MLTGDINLMHVTDPTVPFAQVGNILRSADIVFGNLECCFYTPPAVRSPHQEGFYAAPEMASALAAAGFHAVGLANNVNYGADAIRSSLEILDRHGIAHTGAGLDAASAAAPAVLERAGLRFGFLQRTSVYWPTDHEATTHSPGVAALRGYTAYRPRLEVSKAATRPGAPPEILTWADPDYLGSFQDDVRALARSAQVVVASHHWGYDDEVLAYQREIAYAAIDAGAHIVFGHGPHVPLGVEIYDGRPILYGLGSFSFAIGHRAGRHVNWVGLMARVVLEEDSIVEVTVRPVRRNERNETVVRSVAEERSAMEHLSSLSRRLGTELELGDDAIVAVRR